MDIANRISGTGLNALSDMKYTTANEIGDGASISTQSAVAFIVGPQPSRRCRP